MEFKMPYNWHWGDGVYNIPLQKLEDFKLRYSVAWT